MEGEISYVKGMDGGRRAFLSGITQKGNACLRNLFFFFLLSIIFPAKDQETERIATDHIYKVCQSGHDHEGGE